jgi:sec-independent protein translocase protein TatC
VLLFGIGTYFVQQKVVAILLEPAHGQHFIYTTPGGGLDFLFKICIFSGLLFSTPIIIYNFLGFCEPMMSHTSRRFVTLTSLACAALAGCGVVFGYFVGLPSALHFLLHQFTTVQIRPLVTIQSYLSFVVAYMIGSALLFQLPMILIIINRIKPLKPKKLLHYERWVILVAFVLAGLMNPTPNIFSQLLVAGPFILGYQLSIIILAILNRNHNPEQAAQLIKQDSMVQAQRQTVYADAKPLVNSVSPLKTQGQQINVEFN